MAPRPLIIDTDPGKDDAVAILSALGVPDALDVQMMTAAQGNVALEKTAANILRLCELAGRVDIAVHAGCPRPILQPSNAAPHVHGDDGLGGAGLPMPAMALSQGHAVPAIVDAIRTSSRPVTIAGLAPLTNIAMALVMAPDIVGNIERIAVMGGSFSGGNITPFASYNLHSDPHAARIVFECGAPVTMVGLDVTRKTMPSPQWLAALRATGSAAGVFVADLWSNPTLCFNDACVIGYLLEPSLFRVERTPVEIEINDPVEIGRTRRSPSGRPVDTVMDVDVPAFFDLMRRTLCATGAEQEVLEADGAEGSRPAVARRATV